MAGRNGIPVIELEGTGSRGGNGEGPSLDDIYGKVCELRDKLKGENGGGEAGPKGPLAIVRESLDRCSYSEKMTALLLLGLLSEGPAASDLANSILQRWETEVITDARDYPEEAFSLGVFLGLKTANR